jgi:hypothetical protein
MVHPGDPVGFLYRWYLYGGGAVEDIFVEYGLTEREFFGRLLSTLENSPDARFERSVVDAMRRVCRARLWVDTGRTHRWVSNDRHNAVSMSSPLA